MTVTHDATNAAIVIGHADASPVIIPKSQITKVSGNALKNSAAERSSIHFNTTRTGLGGVVYIHVSDGSRHRINLIKVSNQATWVANDANKTDVDTAIADIQSWLP